MPVQKNMEPYWMHQVALTILFNVNHLLVDSEVVTSIAIQHYLLICTLLNDQTVLFSLSQQS